MPDAAAQAKDAAWALAGQATFAVTMAARGVLLAALLTPDDLGRVFLLISAGAVLASLGQPGVSTAGLRRVAAATTPGAISAGVRDAVTITTSASAIGIALGLAGGLAAGLPLPQAVAVAGFAAARLWLSVFAALVRGLHRVVLGVQQDLIVSSILQLAAIAACYVWRVTLTPTLVMAIFGLTLVPSIVVLAVPILAAARAHPTRAPGESPVAMGIEAGPVVLHSLVWQALSDLPLWAAGLWTGPAGSAIFGIAQQMSRVLQLPMLALASSMAPRIAALYGRGARAELERHVRRAATLATAITVAGLVGLVLFGRPLVGVFFGPFFEPAVEVAVVLGVAQVVNAASGLGGLSLLMMNAPRRLLAVSLVSTVALAILVVVLGRPFGLMGLAWAWVGGLACQNTLTVWSVYRLSGVRVYLDLGVRS